MSLTSQNLLWISPQAMRTKSRPRPTTCSSDIFNTAILIVDDPAADAAAVEEMLRHAGYRSISSIRNPRAGCCGLFHPNCFLSISLATNLPELYPPPRRTLYSLVLLDPQAPDLNEFHDREPMPEVEANRDLPILVIMAEPDRKLRMIETEAQNFVSEPFELAELLTQVRKFLQLRPLHQDTEMRPPPKRARLELVHAAG